MYPLFRMLPEHRAYGLEDIGVTLGDDHVLLNVDDLRPSVDVKVKVSVKDELTGQVTESEETVTVDVILALDRLIRGRRLSESDKKGITEVFGYEQNTVPYGLMKLGHERLQQLDEVRLRDSGLKFRLEPGLTLIAAPSGVGKTRALTDIVVQLREQVGVGLLDIGEPMAYTPWSTLNLTAALFADVSVVCVDSIMGIWADSDVSKDMAIGRGGASLGVAKYVSSLQRLMLMMGKCGVLVVNPQQTDLDLIRDPLIGASSTFVDLGLNQVVSRVTPASLLGGGADAAFDDMLTKMPSRRSGNASGYKPKPFINMVDGGE